MSPPWKGAARRAYPDDFAAVARELGCDEPALFAIWQVEAGGRGFRSDGSLIRRFEPHHFYESGWDWRRSLALSTSRREALFHEAYAEDPAAALRACSWGGPQIMGFNAADAGYGTVTGMVAAMAESEVRQLSAFAALIKAWGIDGALRAHDWRAFARRYNGSGQVDGYARKIEAAYRSASGRSSATIVQPGDRGESVKRAQRALGVEVDGIYGPRTREAIEAFQQANGLAVDGLVGEKTWSELEAARGARPRAQPTPADAGADLLATLSGAGAAISGAVPAINTVRDVLPAGAFTALAYGAVALAILTAGALILRQLRGAA